MSGGLRRSPLDAWHRAAGAVMTPFAGWELPLRFSSERAEHRAVRTAVGVFDLSHMGEIEVRGPGAAEVLDATFVGHLSAVRPGRAKYTLLCDEAGGVLDDVVAYRLDAGGGDAHDGGSGTGGVGGGSGGGRSGAGDSGTGGSGAGEDFLVVANAANVATVHAALARAAGSRGEPAGTRGGAEVRDVTAETALVAVQGPASADVVAQVVDGDDGGVTELRRYACRRASVAGVPGVVGRTGYTGEDGFELYVPASQATAVWEAVLDAGRPAGIVPAGLAARDTLRLEAGMALYGHELTTSTTPFEAGLGRLVAFDKPGDFPGREALRAASGVEPRRRLVGVTAEGRRILRPGQQLAPAATVAEPVETDEPAAGPVAAGAGGPVGEVTSGAWSVTLDRSIALAYLPTELAEPGTALVADVRGTRVPATVVAAPHYRRPSTPPSTAGAPATATT